MKNKLYIQMEKVYQENLAIFWADISRLNNLLIILNISMFFLTGLVAQGYYYTFYSLFCLLLVALGTLLPVPFAKKLGYYMFFVALEFISLYFLISSIVYWVRTGPN